MAVTGAFFLMLIAAIISNTNTFFLTAVTEELGCTHAQFSACFMVLRIAMAVVCLFMGPIMHHLRLRYVLLIGCIGASCGYLLLSQLQNLAMLYLGAAICGMFTALNAVPVVSIVNAWCPVHNGLPMGIVMAATGFGSLGLGQIMPYWILSRGWRSGYLLLAVLYFVFSLLGTILGGADFPNEHPVARHHAQKPVRQSKENYRSIIFSPQFLLVLLCFMLGAGCPMISQHLSAHLSYKGMTLSLVSLLMSFWGAAMIVCKISQGALYDRIRPIIFIPLVFALSALGYLPLVSNSTLGLAIGIFTYGFAGSTVNTMYPLVFREIYGLKTATALWGICYFAINIGQGVFSPLFGAVYDTCGTYDPSLWACFGITMFMTVTFFILLLRKRKAQ